jgi:hypothetical protein
VDEEQRFDELYRDAGPRLWRAVLASTGGRRDLTDDVVGRCRSRENADDATIGGATRGVPEEAMATSSPADSLRGDRLRRL